MGAQTDRLRCEVFQNLILSPINTGFLRHAVATALTVYGIETLWLGALLHTKPNKLQQPLPFTVLKLIRMLCAQIHWATCCNSPYRLRYWNLPRCLRILRKQRHSCNSPYRLRYWNIFILSFWTDKNIIVATALTVYGIETCYLTPYLILDCELLQQPLPFTVLKRRKRRWRS